MPATSFSITDATAATVQVAADPLRESVVLQNDISPSTRVHIGFNENASFGSGLYLDPGQAMTLVGKYAKSPILMVCDTAQTATIYAEV